MHACSGTFLVQGCMQDMQDTQDVCVAHHAAVPLMQVRSLSCRAVRCMCSSWEAVSTRVWGRGGACCVRIALAVHEHNLQHGFVHALGIQVGAILPTPPCRCLLLRQWLRVCSPFRRSQVSRASRRWTAPYRHSTRTQARGRPSHTGNIR